MGANRTMIMKIRTYTRHITFALIVVSIKYIIIINLLFDFYLVEFIDKQHAEIQQYILIYVLPILMLLSLIGTLQKKQGIIRNILNIFLTIFFTIGSWMFFGIMSFSSGMCGRVNEKTIYVSQENRNMTIIECYIDCGATDSGGSTKIYRKITQYFNLFRIVVPIDPDHLNMDQWISAKSPKRVKNKIGLAKFSLKKTHDEK